MTAFCLGVQTLSKLAGLWHKLHPPAALFLYAHSFFLPTLLYCKTLWLLRNLLDIVGCQTHQHMLYFICMLQLQVYLFIFIIYLYLCFNCNCTFQNNLTSAANLKYLLNILCLFFFKVDKNKMWHLVTKCILHQKWMSGFQSPGGQKDTTGICVNSRSQDNKSETCWCYSDSSVLCRGQSLLTSRCLIFLNHTFDQRGLHNYKDQGRWIRFIHNTSTLEVYMVTHFQDVRDKVYVTRFVFTLFLVVYLWETWVGELSRRQESL